MRHFLVLSLSAVCFSGCLTTQQNPNYEQSTAYKGDPTARHQYAYSEPITRTMVAYETVPAASVSVETAAFPSSAYSAATTLTASTETQPHQTQIMGEAPTDSLYGAGDVSGTPGFMLMEDAGQAVVFEAATAAMPETEIVSIAPLGAAGTPIDYDYSRNLVSVDALTTGTQMPDSVRIRPSVGGNYTVKQGDTVYSLSRQTCVGVNVIQSMNGLNTDFAIKIGQSLTLPASVC